MNILHTEYEYIIESSIDLDEVLDSMKNQLNLKEGELTYFKGESHTEIKKILEFDELKKNTLEKYNNEKWPSLSFEDVNLMVDEDSIFIESRKKLNLMEFDAKENIK